MKHILDSQEAREFFMDSDIEIHFDSCHNFLKLKHIITGKTLEITAESDYGVASGIPGIYVEEKTVFKPVKCAIVRRKETILNESTGDLMTLKEFLANVKCGCVTPDDGSGCWATEKVEFGDTSVWDGKPVPKETTHVMWYNK